MTEEMVPRSEFDGYTRRHESDPVAHAVVRDHLREEWRIPLEAVQARLTALEYWQQRIIGGLMFGAVLIGGGATAAVIEFARGK